MKILGITGSSGSGKSTVCQIIKENYKSEIIDADKVVKELQNNKTEYYEKIVQIFGKEILLENGLINRKKLSEIIFTNSSEKDKIDKLTFYYVVNEIKRRIEISSQKDLEYIIVDAPTLLEAGMVDMFDKIIVVVANKENKINRICIRDEISREEAINRLKSQKEDEFYLSKADFVITNDNDKIEEKVKEIFKEIGR